MDNASKAQSTNLTPQPPFPNSAVGLESRKKELARSPPEFESSMGESKTNPPHLFGRAGESASSGRDLSSSAPEFEDSRLRLSSRNSELPNPTAEFLKCRSADVRVFADFFRRTTVGFVESRLGDVRVL